MRVGSCVMYFAAWWVYPAPPAVPAENGSKYSEMQNGAEGNGLGGKSNGKEDNDDHSQNDSENGKL